jgi:hypothetical protein
VGSPVGIRVNSRLATPEDRTGGGEGEKTKKIVHNLACTL